MEFLQQAKFSSRQEKMQRRFVHGFERQGFFFNKKKKRKKKKKKKRRDFSWQVLSQCRKTELQWNDEGDNRSRETAAESEGALNSELVNGASVSERESFSVCRFEADAMIK